MIYLLLFILTLLLIGMFLYLKKQENRIQQEQLSLLENHSKEVEALHRDMRGWRHDYKNQLQIMKAYLELGETEQLQNYLHSLDQDLSSINVSIRSGNYMIDAILNSKLSLAKSKQIAFNAKATAAQELPFAAVDIGVLLSNLLTNAMEANEKIENIEKRFIRVYIHEIQGYFYINVTNAMDEKIPLNRSLLTSKKERDHGHGLRRIDAIVKRYGGDLNRQQEIGVFATEIMLPLTVQTQ